MAASLARQAAANGDDAVIRFAARWLLGRIKSAPTAVKVKALRTLRALLKDTAQTASPRGGGRAAGVEPPQRLG